MNGFFTGIRCDFLLPCHPVLDMGSGKKIRWIPVLTNGRCFAVARMAAIICCLLTSFAFASDKIASVGKYEITKTEAELASKGMGLGEFSGLELEARRAVTRMLLNDKILESLAKKEKLEEQNDVQIAIRKILVSKYIESHSGNLEVLARKKYDEAAGLLKNKKTYTFSHILVKDKFEADKLKKMITGAGKKWLSEFRKLAKEKSLDTATAKNNGLVGNIPEIKLPEEFVKNIKNKKTNTLIGPFKTDLGYHIAFVEKVEAMHIEPYDKVKNLFMGQIFQEETERLAKESLKGKEIEYGF